MSDKQEQEIVEKIFFRSISFSSSIVADQRDTNCR